MVSLILCILENFYNTVFNYNLKRHEETVFKNDTYIYEKYSTSVIKEIEMLRYLLESMWLAKFRNLATVFWQNYGEADIPIRC